LGTSASCDLFAAGVPALAERHGSPVGLTASSSRGREAGERVEHGTRRRRRAGLTLSINVSPDRLATRTSARRCARCSSPTPCHPPCLVFELSEVGLMNLFARDHKVARGLLELASSLPSTTSPPPRRRWTICTLPGRRVKVDRSLVRVSARRQTMARTRRRGHHLHRAPAQPRCGGRSVETAEQAAHLTSLGCEYAQGSTSAFPPRLYSSRRGCSP